MSSVTLFDLEGKAVGEKALSEEFLKHKPNRHAIKSAVVGFLAHQRRGTASTKTRGEVSGSGRKPWKQKGTGRARSGERTSPVWRGGGVVFGPRPHDFHYHVNRRVAALAKLSALNVRFTDNKMVVVKDLKVAEPKAKLAAQLLKNLKVSGKVLIVMKDIDPKFKLAFRNLAGVDLIRLADLNAYEILSHSRIVFSEDAFDGLPIHDVHDEVQS